MMIKRIWRNIFCVFLISICIGLPESSLIMAAPSSSYIITPITDQKAEEKTPYFDRVIAAGHKEKMEIELQNPTDQPVTVSIQSYTLEGKENHKLSDLITGYRSLTIPPQKSFVFQFTAAIPDTGLSADVNGALTFLLSPGQPAETTKEQKAKDINLAAQQIQSPEDVDLIPMEKEEIKQPGKVQKTIADLLPVEQESYVVPIFLRASKEGSKADLSLKEVLTENHQDGLQVVLHNTSEQQIEKVTLEAVVRKKGKKKIYYDVKEENATIPANSDYQFEVKRKGELVDSDEYTVQVYLTGENAQWEWTKDIMIQEDGEVAVGERPFLLRLELVHYLAVGGILGILVVLIAIIMIRKKQRDEEAAMVELEIIKELIKQNI